MKILYSINATWELDYIKNIIFKNKYELEFIDFNVKDVNSSNNNINIRNIIDLTKSYNLINNCVIVFSSLNINNISNIFQVVKFLSPKVIIFLSDEKGNYPFITNLSKLTKLFLHNYYHPNYVYNINSVNCFQLPLGYVSGYLDMDIKKINKISERNYNCSFVGELKSDRFEMINVFENNMLNTKLISTNNSWNINNLKITPKELFSIYSNSIFVLNGRGFVSLDCFRIYEAIIAGAIPVVVGSQEEINNTFYYNNQQPYLVYDNSWENVLKKCLKLLENKEDLQIIQDYNLDWWKNKNNFIIDKVNKALC